MTIQNAKEVRKLGLIHADEVKRARQTAEERLAAARRFDATVNKELAKLAASIVLAKVDCNPLIKDPRSKIEIPKAFHGLYTEGPLAESALKCGVAKPHGISGFKVVSCAQVEATELEIIEALAENGYTVQTREPTHDESYACNGFIVFSLPKE